MSEAKPGYRGRLKSYDHTIAAWSVFTCLLLLVLLVLTVPYMDLPPGDWNELALHNDTSQTYVVFTCTDDACTAGYDKLFLAPGNTDTVLASAWTPGPLALAEPGTSKLVACLTGLPQIEVDGHWPTGELVYPTDLNVALSRHQPCSGAPAGTVVTWRAPGG